MKKYKVKITEILERTVEVEAGSREAAEDLVAKQWKNSEHILDADDFKDVSFKAKPDKPKDIER